MAETIKVAVRVRPLIQRELDAGATIVVAIHNNAVTVDHGPQRRTFGFDHAYWSVDAKDAGYASQEHVNNDIGKPCLENMLKGYNFCVFAYGQTGAGKTHTLSASSSKGDKQMGLIPFVLEGLFTHHRAKFKNDELRIWISFMEIYNEQIRDLLNPGRDAPDLKVRDHPEFGAYVPGLTEAPCSEIADVKKLMDFGTKKRVTAATNMNAGSSRSHAVFTIRAQRLTGTKPGKKDRKSLSSRVNLVDLAGSERIAKSGADGLRLREGCAINQSLTALGLVIKQLAEIQRDGGKKGAGRRKSTVDEQTKAIPFRASKLTFLLRESLAGNSKTFMVGAISPASCSADETVSTLRFASSVKRVKTVALQNVNKKAEAVASLQAEVTRLAEMLANAGAHGAGDAMITTLHDDLEERERLLQEMTKSHRQEMAEAKLIQAKREEVLKEMGVTQQDLAQTIGIDKDVPYLLNMNEDPALAGKMMYFLPPGQPITIGTHPDNKIVLQGLRMPEHLCAIENLQDQIVVRTCKQPETGNQGLSMKARVCVNGSAMQENEQRKLKHNDKLFLGRVSAVRLIVPEAARSLGQAGSALPEREQDAELLRSVVPEDSRAWAELHLHLEDLRSRLGEESGQEVFRTLIEASGLVDEANEITAAIRPGDNLKFEVELAWDIHRAGAATDIVVIRLMKMKEAPAEPDDEDLSPTSNTSEVDADNMAVAYWTLLKFKARLDQMRDCFDEHQQHGRWSGSGDCLRDPWMEPSIVELKQRLVAHLDAESRRRCASKASGAALSPRDQATKVAAQAAAQVRFGSKASMVSAESLRGPGSREASKVRMLQPTLGRRLTPRGVEASPVPRNAPSTSSTARAKPQVLEDLGGLGSLKAPLSPFARSESCTSISSHNQPKGALKDELGESMKAQLREKTEKEELYRLRIEYLQQQIELYNSVRAQVNPWPQVDRSPRVMGRARSSSPSREPQTSDAGLSTIATTRFAVRTISSAVRSMSARDAIPPTTTSPPVHEVPVVQVTSKEPLTVPGSLSPRYVAKEPLAPIARGGSVSPAPIWPKSCEAPVEPRRMASSLTPERTMEVKQPLRVIPHTVYSVATVRNAPPNYTPVLPLMVLQGRPKEPLAVPVSSPRVCFTT
ncbi:unnamed protein product [Effrenium voratum]|uniref:Kinesin motor domain-containing protein n=1 Tax=Effrenium voratum TaxID=2562239 RepID=A0AA36MVG9_9DINO|nr:unnamed protein product [Effrenium voratum]